MMYEERPGYPGLTEMLVEGAAKAEPRVYRR